MEQSKDIRVLEHQHKNVAESIYAVFQRAYQIEADLLGVADFPPLKRSAEDLAASPRSFYGLYKSDELAAVVEVEIENNVIDICSLVVDPAYFRQGIASELMSYVLHTFNCQGAVVETAAANQPAINLYKRHGFTEGKSWTPEHGILKVQLHLQLSPAQ